MILVDTNVLLDIATEDPQWGQWSQRQLADAMIDDRLGINAAVYAEFSVRYASIDDVEDALSELGIVVAEIPRLALFVAGKAFREYRRRGGVRTGVLADFFIGAHAAVEGMQLITRDPRRYETYFPTVELIAPGE